MYSNRSSLSEGIRNQTANRFILTLSARGPQVKNEPIQNVIIPKSFPSHSQYIRSSLSYTTSTNTIYTESVTLPTKTLKTSTTSKTTETPKVYSLPKIKHALVLPVDHYYYSDQIAQDYYDNVDEISIPSHIESLNHNRIRSSSLQSSSASLFLPTSPPEIYVRLAEPLVRNTQSKFSEYSRPFYEQSTLKSFFMKHDASMPDHLPLSTPKTEHYSEIAQNTTIVSTETSAQDSDPIQQQLKIHSFVVSDNQPSSFKAPPISPSFTLRTKSLVTNQNNNFNNYNAFVNMQKLSTTLTPSTTIPSTIFSISTTPNSQFTSMNNRNNNNSTPSFYLHSSNQSHELSRLKLSRDELAQNKISQLTLSSELSLPSNKSAQFYRNPYSQVSVEEIQLNKIKQPEKNDNLQSLYLKLIEPTTYAPINPFKPSAPDNFKNPATFSFQNAIIDDSSESDSFTHSRRRPYLNTLHSEPINPTRYPPRTTTLNPSTSSTTTPFQTTAINVVTSPPNNLSNFKAFNENIQSFTSRGLIFKETLNRTLEPQYQIKPIVSPFISLENQRFTNAIRNTSPSPQAKDYFSKYFSTTTNVPNIPTRSYFLITAPSKETTTRSSTFLFPESSTLTTSSVYSTTKKPLITSESTSQFYSSVSTTHTLSSDHSRGRYRPYVTYATENSNDVEEPTTYAPRMRYNTRTQTLVDTAALVETPQQRRKRIRSKSTTIPSKKSFEQFISSTEQMPHELTAKFVASPSHETSQFIPIYSKSNFSSNKSIFGEKSNATSLTLLKFKDFKNVNESLHHFNEPQDSIIQITDKPIYYARYRSNNAINKGQVLEETSTKKFRATIEMPEMNVPTEKQNEKSYFKNEENYVDENEKQNHLLIDSLDLIENDYNREHEVDYAYVDFTNSTTSTTRMTSAITTINTTIQLKTGTSTEKLPLTTYSTTTSSQQPTTARTTTTTHRTTEKPLSTTSPKSMIPPRVSRVNNAIKTSIEATLPRRIPNPSSAKCNDNSPNALQCNEIPSRYYNDKNNTH